METGATRGRNGMMNTTTGLDCTWCDRHDDDAVKPFVCDECVDHMATHREGHHDTRTVGCPLCDVEAHALDMHDEDERVQTAHEHTSGMHDTARDARCDMCAFPAADLPRIMEVKALAPVTTMNG